MAFQTNYEPHSNTLGTTWYTCLECGADFLYRRLRIPHDVVEHPYFCPKCGKRRDE